MENLTITLTPQMLYLVPIVGAILQVIKGLGVYEKIKKWTPFLAIGISLALGFLTKMNDPILPSIIIGLIASGGYDLLKAPTK